MSVDTLYVIFGVTILVFVLLVLVGRRNNPNFNVGFGMVFGILLAAFIVYFLTYFYGVRGDLSLVWWITIGLVIFFILWGIAEVVRKRKSNEEHTQKKVFDLFGFSCHNGECDLTSVTEVEESRRGEKITTVTFSDSEDDDQSIRFLTESSMDDSDVPFGSLGNMRIKYLA